MSSFDFHDFLSCEIRKCQIEIVYLFSFWYIIETEVIFLL